MKGAPRTLSPSEEMGLLGGAVLQPFLAAIFTFVTFPILLLDGEGRTLAGGYPSDPTDSALSAAVGVGIVAAVVTLIGVLPTALWLLKRRQPALGKRFYVAWDSAFRTPLWAWRQAGRMARQDSSGA